MGKARLQNLTVSVPLTSTCHLHLGSHRGHSWLNYCLCTTPLTRWESCAFPHLPLSVCQAQSQLQMRLCEGGKIKQTSLQSQGDLRFTLPGNDWAMLSSVAPRPEHFCRKHSGHSLPQTPGHEGVTEEHTHWMEINSGYQQEEYTDGPNPTSSTD